MNLKKPDRFDSRKEGDPLSIVLAVALLMIGAMIGFLFAALTAIAARDSENERKK